MFLYYQNTWTKRIRKFHLLKIHFPHFKFKYSYSKADYHCITNSLISLFVQELSWNAQAYSPASLPWSLSPSSCSSSSNCKPPLSHCLYPKSQPGLVHVQQHWQCSQSQLAHAPLENGQQLLTTPLQELHFQPHSYRMPDALTTLDSGAQLAASSQAMQKQVQPVFDLSIAQAHETKALALHVHAQNPNPIRTVTGHFSWHSTRIDLQPLEYSSLVNSGGLEPYNSNQFTETAAFVGIGQSAPNQFSVLSSTNNAPSPSNNSTQPSTCSSAADRRRQQQMGAAPRSMCGRRSSSEERRVRNNEASRRSQRNQKAKQEQLQRSLELLDADNHTLQSRLQRARTLLRTLREQVVQKMKSQPWPSDTLITWSIHQKKTPLLTILQFSYSLQTRYLFKTQHSYKIDSERFVPLLSSFIDLTELIYTALV